MTDVLKKGENVDSNRQREVGVGGMGESGSGKIEPTVLEQQFKKKEKKVSTFL